MPRPRKRPNTQLTPGQASYVLDRLIAERRISAGDVSRYVSDMGREIEELARKLESLRAAHGGAAPSRRPGRPPRAAAAPAAEGADGGTTRRRRRSRSITAEQKASRQLQGRYLGLIRQIPASRRAQYQRTAKEKGREAAIKDMASALGK